MKKAVIALWFLISVCMCNACGNHTTSEVQTNNPVIGSDETELMEIPEAVSYEYDEAVFRESYESALEAIKAGNKPDTTPPADPGETGFGVIELSREQYGIDAFAILPVIDREMTEEELLQLADAMGGISFDLLISQKYSWMGIPGQPAYNRLLTWEERIRTYELESRYFFEGLEPESQAAQNGETGDIVCVETSYAKALQTQQREEPVRLLIYPRAEMTEEQLLQAIVLKYTAPKEYYQPLEGQISYQEVEEAAARLAEEYNLSDKPPAVCYPLYLSYRYAVEHTSTPVGVRPDQWLVKLHFAEGYDYRLAFLAENGAFVSFIRCPSGAFGPSEPEGFDKELEGTAGVQRQEEEIEAAANAYLEKIFGPQGINVEEISVSTQEITTLVFGDGLLAKGVSAKSVLCQLSDGASYEMIIMQDDLSIQRLNKMVE